MDDATRTIEIERKITTKLENTELPGELYEVHRGLKGCARNERCDAVPLAWMLETCTEFKLQLETFMRTLGSMGIAGSDLGRPALAGLSSFTWVEETIAKAKLCDDDVNVKAKVVDLGPHGWPRPLGFGFGGRLLLARRGRVCLSLTKRQWYYWWPW